MMFLSSKARGGAQKEIGGGSGEECDRRMVCVCLVCVRVCEREGASPQGLTWV